MRRSKKPASLDAKDTKILKNRKNYHLGKWKWRKGCASPNPSGLPGRPKKLEIQTIVRAFPEFGEVVALELNKKDRYGRTNLQMMVETWTRRARQLDTEKGKVLIAAYIAWFELQQSQAGQNFNQSQMDIGQVHAKLAEHYSKLGIPKPVWSPGGLTLDRDAVRSRIEQLLEKRRVKGLPKPQIVPGSEVLQ
jgi:hypothetical protein